MLRILEILVILAIIIYGGIKIIEMFSFKKKANKRATSLEELKTKAKKAAEEKSKILEETKKTKKTIDEINNTLNK